MGVDVQRPWPPEPVPWQGRRVPHLQPAGSPSPPRGFLDAASGEPLHPAARAAFEAALDAGWADPGRLYGAARRARALLDGARESVARGLGCRADEVRFAASGTQAVHHGVAGLAAGRHRVGRHVVGSAVEHAAALHALAAATDAAAGPTLVPVDTLGRVDPAAFAAALRPDTALACLQSANHEVGTVQPVPAVAAACRAAGVPLLVDAAQSVGRAAVPADWSVLAASAHKWGGPPGVGVLAVRTGTRWRLPGPGPDPSDGRLPGFTDLPAALAAAVALEAVAAAAPAEDARLRALADRVRERVPATVPDVQVVGDPDDRLPHIVTFSCLYVDGEALITELDALGFAASSGSSCTSSTLEPSHVLVAMGAVSHGNVRVSLPRGVRADDVERFLAVLPEVVARVRDRLGVTGL
jgi:cysteine desulfurase